MNYAPDTALELERLLLLLRRTAWTRRAGPLERVFGGVVPDAVPTELVHAISDVEATLAASSSPVRRLGAAMGLVPFERDVLLLALAPELDVDFVAAYAHLAGDPYRGHATVDLALAVFEPDDRAAARAMLRPERRLFTEGLLVRRTEDHASTLLDAFTAAPLVVEALEGAPYRAPEGCIRPPALELTGHQDASRLEAFAGALADGTAPAIVVLIGGAVADTFGAAAHIAAHRTQPLLSVDLGRLPTGADRVTALRSIRLRARLDDAALYVRGLWSSASIAADIDALAWGGPVFVDTDPDDAWRLSSLGAPAHVLKLSPPSFEGRVEQWRRAIHATPCDLDESDLQDIARTYELSDAQVVDAVREAAVSLRVDRGTSKSALTAACRSRLEHELGRLAVRGTDTDPWDDLVLPDATRERLEAFVSAIRHRARVFVEWGVGGAAGRNAGVCALFAGPSGTGKTMAAGVAASEVGLDLYRVDLAGVVSKYIGETEKNLDRVFEAARRSNALLFFDEAEAILGKRSEVKDARDRYSNIEVAYLLQRIERHAGPVVFATNLAKNMDAAFTRRIQFALEFPMPDAELRRRIWQRTLGRGIPLDDDVLIDLLADGFEASGGQIRNIAVDAAFAAAREQRSLRMRDLLDAATRHLRRDGRMLDRITLQRFQPAPSLDSNLATHSGGFGGGGV
ncbi:MAG: ATP-binding protein [Deltaproteobacteria bacterium]|jgi:hypothetical protein